MNRVFDKGIIHKIILLFTVVVALFFLSTLAMLFLPKVSIEKVVESRVEIPYVNYKLGDIFYVTDPKESPKESPKEEQTYELNNLELKAIFADEHGKGWIVLVDKGTQKSEVLKNDDEYKGYRLVEIRPQSALFENSGKKYTVTINKPEMKELVTSPLVATASAKKTQDTPLIRAVPRREIDKYRQNYKAIWKNIKIKETVEHGEITGFKILWIKEDSIFAQLGFKVGDIIKAVNNKELKSYADAFKIYNTIQSYKSLKFTILRDKEVRELEYEVY